VLKNNSLQVGKRVRCLEDNTCMRKGDILILQKDHEGFYVHCALGNHYLDGQTTEGGEIPDYELVD
jgi:hypothetical protein